MTRRVGLRSIKVAGRMISGRRFPEKRSFSTAMRTNCWQMANLSTRLVVSSGSRGMSLITNCKSGKPERGC